MNVENIYSSEFIDEIVQHNVNRNLIRYNLFMKFIMNHSPLLEERDLAISIYDQSKKIPPGALAAVFSDPSFSYWIYLSTCITRRLENGEEIPESDLPYLKGLANKHLRTPLHFHLIEINRFLFSASMLSRSPMEASINFLEDVFYLPILGLYFTSGTETTQTFASYKSEEDTFKFKIGDQQFDQIEKLLFLAERGSSEFIQEGNAFLQASILGNGGKMILDRVDPFIRFEWSMRYRNPDGSRYLPIGFSEIKKEVPVVIDAFQLIEKYWIEMANHISSTIQVVHLVKSPNPDRHMSCTSLLFFGSILTSTGNELQLSEALVHEYSHNLLNMVILAGEIFESQIPQEEIYYSPWREDPRPISGVLHAVFVFTNVSELLDRLSVAFPNDIYLNTRRYENFIRLEMGLMVLREFSFKKDFANAILADLESKIQRLRIAFSLVDLKPYKRTQIIHLKQWIENNGIDNLPISLLNYLVKQE